MSKKLICLLFENWFRLYSKTQETTLVMQKNKSHFRCLNVYICIVIQATGCTLLKVLQWQVIWWPTAKPKSNRRSRLLKMQTAIRVSVVSQSCIRAKKKSLDQNLVQRFKAFRTNYDLSTCTLFSWQKDLNIVVEATPIIIHLAVVWYIVTFYI